MRDYEKCSGCRRCEIACSLEHEGKIWPEASRIRVFMLFPGLEIPHLCSQCEDYPCIGSCPVDALSIDPDMKNVIVDIEKCTACGNCVEACPGRIPNIHPEEDYALICDFCGGDPQCVKACHEGRWDCLYLVSREISSSYKLYSRRPEDITKDLAVNMFGEKGEEVV